MSLLRLAPIFLTLTTISSNALESTDNKGTHQRDIEKELNLFYFPSLASTPSLKHLSIRITNDQQLIESGREEPLDKGHLDLDTISDEDSFITQIESEMIKNQKNDPSKRQAGIVLRETLPVGVGAGSGALVYLGISGATTMIPALAATPAIIPLAAGGSFAFIGYVVSRVVGGSFFQNLPQQYSFSDIIPDMFKPKEKALMEEKVL